MNFFNRLIMFIKLRTKFIPYIKLKESKLKNTEFIDSEFDERIIAIYDKLTKDETRYSNQILNFNMLKNKIKIHNENLTKVLKFNENYNLNKLLQDPYSIDLSYLNEYLSVVSNFKLKDNDNRIKEEIEELVNNIDDIKYQFEILNYQKYIVPNDDRYIDKKELKALNIEYYSIMEKIKNQPKIWYDFKFLDDLSNEVDKHNSDYIRNHLNDGIFNNINGKSLDLDQRTSILKNDNACLTIAGAGSGKTLTICGKVKYLLEKEHISPKDILLLSYSKKSSEDLSLKIHNINKELEVATFHKLGLEILKVTNNRNYIVEDQYEMIIEKFFREELIHRPEIAKKVLEYYSLYINYHEDKNYKNKDEMYKDLKNKDYTTLKDLLISLSTDVEKKKTIKKEYVKSFEELAIANFYFINGINYTYEHPYEYDVPALDEKVYKPDFYLNDYNIYHEHYGVDKNGNANQYGPVEGKRYVYFMKYKHELHKNHGTKCLETFSYEFKDDTVFEKLKKQLIDNGVELKPLGTEEVLNALNSIYMDHKFNSLIKVISTFISLYKAKYKDVSYFDKLWDLKKKSSNIYDNLLYKHRVCLFLDICKEIYNYYYETIRKEDKIDFDDMIILATDNINKTEEYKYKYIIVDEFQDISYSRMQFLKAILNHNNANLYAVGDDWQAIYRFSGCDLGIFTEFGNYFGDCEISKIHATHRNSQELQDIVTPFIIKNDDQIKKIIKSDKHLKDPINIVYYKDSKYTSFIKTLEYISKENSNANVLVLGRVNKDIDSICSDNVYYNTRNKKKILCKDYPNLNLTYSTVHASKGLEEDYVILINADDGTMGFPNMIEDDPVLSLVLSEDNNYPFAEERRLFYVALTRTRTKCFIITSVDKPSIFVNEIKDKCNILNNELIDRDFNPSLCPKCHGRLILKESGDGHPFYGCSNYPYCDYTISDLMSVEYKYKCPICGDYMVLRKDRYGHLFYGCHNYPKCKHTERSNIHNYKEY